MISGSFIHSATESMLYQTPTADLNDFSALHLTPDSFERFYKTVTGLKFPLDVARVLELRYLINHTVDAFPEPAPTSDYRQFRDALQAVIDSIGIDNKRHSEKLLRILCMLRELHYAYSIKTRDAENDLRARMAANRSRRRRSVRNAVVFAGAAAAAGGAWYALGDPGWAPKLATVAAACGAWYHVHVLPLLDRRLRNLERRLAHLQDRRVKSIHWRLLVQKLALLLGYKRNSEVEVFLIDPEHYDHTYASSRLSH